jgi:hypothetical protein
VRSRERSKSTDLCEFKDVADCLQERLTTGQNCATELGLDVIKF